MTEFKKGDRVRRTKAGRGVYRAVFEGSEWTVRSSRGRTGLVEGCPLSVEWKNFELVEPASPKWSDVEPGDKVKVRLKATGQEVDAEAYHEQPDSAGYVRVLGYTTHGMGPAKYDLLSIEKPKPLPPQTPGSVIFKLTPRAEKANNGRGFALLRQTHDAAAPWIGSIGQHWTDEDVQALDGGGFEVLYDAGKDA